MPVTANLQIRDRGLKTARVVALSSEFARVGRSPICDVLILDPKLSRVECRLARDAGQWTIVPERADSRVWVHGSRLTGPLNLDYGQTFQVGDNTLTLRPSEFSVDDDAAEIEPAAVEQLTPIPTPEPVPEPPIFPSRPPDRSEWASRTEKHEPLVTARSETKKWESRWRAVGEKLRESAAAPVSSPRVPVGSMTPPPIAPKPVARTVEPLRAPVSRTVERPLPSASRIVRESRAVPLHSHAAVAPPRPLRPEVNPPIPSPRPSYQSPRPVVSPPVSPYRSAERLRTSDDPKPLAPDPSVEVLKPSAIEVLEPPIVEPLIVREARLVVETLVDDEGDDRENETTAKRTLGTTRRVSRSSRKGVKTPEAERSAPPTLLSKAAARSVTPISEAAVEPIGFVREPASEVVGFVREPGDKALLGKLLIHPAMDAWRHASIDSVGTTESSPSSHGLDRTELTETPEPTTSEFALSFDGIKASVAKDSAADDPPVGETFIRDSVVGQATIEASDPSSIAANLTQTHEEQRHRSDFQADGVRDERARFRRSPIDQEPRRDPSSSQDWPSVSDIFASRTPSNGRPGTSGTKPNASKVRPRPEPTVLREPSTWSMPLWIGWFPATLASLLVIAATVGINGFWTVDNYHAGMVARRLDSRANLNKPLPEGVEPGSTQWWRTSASNLLTWARYFDRAENDPNQLAEARGLLKKASEISPLSPTVRHAAAVAATEGKEADPFALAKAAGQSRDIVTLTHAGRELLKAGKVDSAREAYRIALEMASKTGFGQPISPVLDGSQIRRYSLPTEDLLASVIRDMAAQGSWTFKDWESALPRRTVAPLAAARILQELRHSDAESALNLALSNPVSETMMSGSDRSKITESAVLLAAEAEALAMKDQLKEALECYESAIDRMPIDSVARSWWLNVSGIARRLNRDGERRKALELAKCDDPRDEITLHAIELQKDDGDFVGQTAAKGKNDPETKAASTSVD